MAELTKAGGKRRLDRVLDPEFTRDLRSLDLDELKERRDLCRAEREYLSLLRRLVQGRLDILRAERARRSGDDETSPVVDRLPQVLAGAPRGQSRGEAPLVPVPEEEIALARRRIERLVSDARLSKLEELSGEEIDEVLDRLTEEEQAVSAARSRVLEVHDTLQDEVKERLRERYGGAK